MPSLADSSAASVPALTERVPRRAAAVARAIVLAELRRVRRAIAPATGIERDQLEILADALAGAAYDLWKLLRSRPHLVGP